MDLKNLIAHLTRDAFSSGEAVREKYDAFQALLTHDKNAHEYMAELEEIYHRQIPKDFKAIAFLYQRLASEVDGIVSALDRMRPLKYRTLKDYCKKFDNYIRSFLPPPDKEPADPVYVLGLDAPHKALRESGGQKAANLAEAAAHLEVPLPAGFVITTDAYRRFMEANNLDKEVDAFLQNLDLYSVDALYRSSRDMVRKIRDSRLPDDIKQEIQRTLEGLLLNSGRFAVRSSAVGEDTETTFAGQYGTVLGVAPDGIIEAYKTVVASKFSPTALVYRINSGLSDSETPMAVLALEMIDAKAAGILYTQDPFDPAGEMVVHAVHGLGKSLVDGDAIASRYVIGRDPAHPVLNVESAGQLTAAVLTPDGQIAEQTIPEDQSRRPPIDPQTARTLAQWGVQLESLYNHFQDMEWCIDQDDRPVLLQTRPLGTTDPQLLQKVECDFNEISNAVLVSGGQAASAGIAVGKVYKVRRTADLEQVPAGSVLVAKSASPVYAAVAGRLAAIVTESGSSAGHLASVAREFGLPAIVGATNALDRLPEGAHVTVYTEKCQVFEGEVPVLLNSDCARQERSMNSPYMRRLSAMMQFVSPLELTDPRAGNFIPEGCRSLHDIIRFAHEKAVEAMFHLGDNRLRKVGGSQKLDAGIPMSLYVLDVGGGIDRVVSGEQTVSAKHLLSRPMRALLKGLRHPDIRWGQFSHYDWHEYDKIVMGGSSISADDPMLASHAVVSREYANLNLKFGYHFVIVDAMCGEQAPDNYILFRFSGGGADLQQRKFRAVFLERILMDLGFEVTRKSDLIDARQDGQDPGAAEEMLDQLGRLLGATRLMDMYLKDRESVEKYAEEFMAGRYHFASKDDTGIPEH